MRFARSKKDHFIIEKEDYEYDKTSTKKNLCFKEYDSGSVKGLTIKELKKLMRQLSWIN